MADNFEVTPAERKLIEGLREEALLASAKRRLEAGREFDMDLIKPGMTQEQVAQAAAAIRRATAERERG